jgi:hypothetical protein
VGGARRSSAAFGARSACASRLIHDRSKKEPVMRQSLFLSTLFACSLLSGLALADKPHERPRAHGEVLDRSHRAPATHVARAQSGSVVNAAAASRVSCGEASADCPGTRSASSKQASTAVAREGGPTSRPPAFLQKVLGAERTSFNEAGEPSAMSARAASRVWSRAGSGATREAPAAHQAQLPRKELQASENRSSCNEAGECMQSSKSSKKEWSYQSVKAGTFKGPEAKAPSGAEKALAAMRAQKPTMDGQEQVARRTRRSREP